MLAALAAPINTAVELSELVVVAAKGFELAGLGADHCVLIGKLPSCRGDFVSKLAILVLKHNQLAFQGSVGLSAFQQLVLAGHHLLHFFLEMLYQFLGVQVVSFDVKVLRIPSLEFLLQVQHLIASLLPMLLHFFQFCFSPSFRLPEDVVGLAQEVQLVLLLQLGGCAQRSQRVAAVEARTSLEMAAEGVEDGFEQLAVG